MNFKSSKGFTLIELLVVISIISLLSSVVLASIKDARDNAKQKAFKQEILQLINALELYKSENGRYPQNSYGNQITNTGEVDVLGQFANDFKTSISPYLQSMPKPVLPGGYYFYSSDLGIKCANDTTIPEYVLLVLEAQKGFDEWTLGADLNEGGIDYSYRCFHI